MAALTEQQKLACPGRSIGQSFPYEQTQKIEAVMMLKKIGWIAILGTIAASHPAQLSAQSFQCTLEILCGHIQTCKPINTSVSISSDVQKGTVTFDLGAEPVEIRNQPTSNEVMLSAFGTVQETNTSYMWTIFRDGAALYTVHTFPDQATVITGLGTCEERF